MSSAVSSWRKARACGLGAALLAAGACARPSDSDPGRPLEVLVQNDAETLDPRYVTDAVGMRITRLMHAGLTRLDPETLEPVPYLARSWSWVDGLRLHVELRGDVRFSRTRPLRAADVVATVTAFQSPTVASRHARIFEPIARVEAVGEDAVEIVLKRPHATLLADLEVPVLMAEEAASPPGTALHGLGPYTLVSTRPAEVRLEPREGSPLPRPAHALAVRTVRDENARALRLIAGRADVALNVLSPAVLPALGREPTLNVAARTAANLTYLLTRVDRPPFDDASFRTAVSSAIDRHAITQQLFSGYAQPATSLLPTSHWAKPQGLTPLAHDPAAARATFQRLAPGRVLTLVTSTDRSRQTVARFTAQQLGDVGLHVEVVPLELGTLIARLNAGDFDLAILQLPELAEPNVLRVFLHSQYIPPAGANRARVRDPEVDRLLDEGASTTDRTVRLAAYAALEAHLRERLYLIPLWHEDHVAVTSPRARAFRPSGEGRWLSLAAVP